MKSGGGPELALHCPPMLALRDGIAWQDPHGERWVLPGFPVQLSPVWADSAIERDARAAYSTPIAPWASCPTRWCLVSLPGTWSHSQTALAVELTPAIPAGGVSEGALGSRWALCGKGSSCPSGPVQMPALPVPANRTARLLEGPGLELPCSQTLAWSPHPVTGIPGSTPFSGPGTPRSARLSQSPGS